VFSELSVLSTEKWVSKETSCLFQRHFPSTKIAAARIEMEGDWMKAFNCMITMISPLVFAKGLPPIGKLQG
jgi:hypothetical protein